MVAMLEPARQEQGLRRF